MECRLCLWAPEYRTFSVLAIPLAAATYPILFIYRELGSQYTNKKKRYFAVNIFWLNLQNVTLQSTCNL